MPATTPSPARARLSELRAALTRTPDASAFADAVVWSHAQAVQLGTGGWTVLLKGPRRLRRISALWQAAVSGRPDPAAPVRAWVSSTFADDSAEPAVLRIPARVLEATADGVRERGQSMDAEALAAAVAADPDARLLAGADMPLPADEAGRAWDDAGYAAGVRRVLAAMDASAAAGGAEPLEKVVISRTETLPADDAALWAALERLRADYPQTWVFAVGGLMGATPEILATRDAGIVTSRVLAGSLPRGATEAEDAALRARLAADERLGHEHRWAARSVVEVLAGVVDLEDADPEPTVLTLPNVHHLATDVRGRLRDGRGTVLDVVAALHPTAAVGGTPRAAAVEMIRAIEPVDRGRYAGPVGWLDQDGDGVIALALRCGQQTRGGMRIHAGGGLVPGAIPEEEVAEIQAKLQPMRRALAAR